MSQAYNLGKFANTLNSSGQIDPTTGITGTFPDTNLPTIPINKGGTNLTTVGANNTVLGTDGSAYTYGSISGTITWDTVKTSSFTAVAGYGYLVNTTSSTITVTLPSSPSIGQSVVVVDYAGTAATNNITVDPNGSKINSGGAKLIQTNRTGLTFVYIDSTQGWLAQSNVYSGNPPFVPAPINISYLIVAGGGGGGGGKSDAAGGGGGAGGYQSSTIGLTPSITYTITVGAGGNAGTTSVLGTNGTNSVISGTGLTTITSIGGGYGAGLDAARNGSSGGSGGGSSDGGILGSGTSGQGNNGGGSAGSGARGGGGGGGASAVGSNGTTSIGGNGGNGSASSITGSSVTYAGGGGGGAASTYTIGSGGLGGGGNGSNSGTGLAGTANTGGGGGGGHGGNGTGYNGGAGGSGVVILSIPTAKYTGNITGSPTVTTSGSNTILKYTASGTYTA